MYIRQQGFFVGVQRMIQYVMLLVWQWYKFIRRMFTGRCEIERIAYSSTYSINLACRLNGAIFNSKQLQFQNKLKEMARDKAKPLDERKHELKQYILLKKNIQPNHNLYQFLLIRNLDQYITQIQEIQSLLSQLKQTAIKYDSQVQSHEDSLIQLWSLYLPGEKREARKTLQWQKLGFQGSDPATDFRAMGLLGLTQLIYLGKSFPKTARMILSASQNGAFQYPFAITGINFTSVLLKMLEDGKLNQYLFIHGIEVEQFHILYCNTLFLFGDYYQSEKPSDLMSFPAIFQKFQQKLLGILQQADNHTLSTSISKQEANLADQQ